MATQLHRAWLAGQGVIVADLLTLTEAKLFKTFYERKNPGQTIEICNLLCPPKRDENKPIIVDCYMVMEDKYEDTLVGQVNRIDGETVYCTVFKPAWGTITSIIATKGSIKRIGN